MPDQEKHAEASLLYTAARSPVAAVDSVALRAKLDSMEFEVDSVRIQKNEYIHFICDKVQVLVAGLDLPFPTNHFRGVSRPSEDIGQQGEILSMLEGHCSSLTVLVMDVTGYEIPCGPALRAGLCEVVVDFLLAATSPNLVFWSNDDRLMTAAEAEAALEASVYLSGRQGSTNGPKHVQPRRTLEVPFASTPVPSAVLPLLRAGDIDLTETEFMTDAFVVRPTRPSLAPSQTPRPAHLYAAPHQSPEVVRWFECEPVTTTKRPSLADDRSALRAFLALDDSPEPKRIADTASGRASLYLMSATIAVFALPIGASMLTYNALSGGSFRATSHVMALTGIGLALTSLGLPSPAAALTMMF